MDNLVGAIGQFSGLKSSALSPMNNVQNLAVGNLLPSQKVNGTSFEQVLAHLSSTLTQKIGGAEALSLQQMSGAEVDTRAIVNSIMQAERTLNTAVAIRDKMIQAYLEVSRMQI